MISLVQQEAFKFINSILKSYSLSAEFRYSQDMDLLSEFRRSPRLRIDYATTINEILDKHNNDRNKSNQILGLFNRTPIVRDKSMGNNQPYNIYTCSKGTKDQVELRNSYTGVCNFSVKMLFDSHEACDIVEMIYGYNLANQQKQIQVSYDLGDEFEEITNVPYSLHFSEIEDISFLERNNMRVLSFSFGIQGWILTPFVYYEKTIKEVVLKIIPTINLDTPQCEFHQENNPSVATHIINIYDRS